MAQLSSHFAGNVVIARNRQDRHAQPAEQQIDRAVGRGLVVDDVARQQHGVDREEMTLRVRETGLQPRQRARPAQRARRVLHQVRIRELDQADAAHARGGLCGSAVVGIVVFGIEDRHHRKSVRDQEAPCRIVRSRSRIRSTNT